MEFTFLLKKIVSMFIMPLPLGIFLLILGLIFLYKNKFFKAKVILTLSLLWLFLISYSPLVNTILYHYESRYPTLHTVSEEIQYIYVLGGGHHSDETHPITSQVNESSSVRLSEAIRLYHQLDEKPTIIVSGYSGLRDPIPHAMMQEKLALALGVKKNKLLRVPQPRDTQEEALAAKKIVKSNPFILVTSAYHMQRALTFFHHEGLNPTPAPTNHLANIQYPNYAGFFSISALRKSKIVWHEMLGTLWQKIKGVS